jgi:4,5-dihydroxyphthalate decarboxylase
VRLVPDFVALESAAYQATGVFPIMHLIALRRDVVDAHPWLKAGLQAGFEEAKSRSLDRMRDSTISRYPFPWTFTLAEQAEALFGHDFWPYGIEPNRTTLQAFLDMCVEQGVTQRRVSIEQLFA